MIKVDVVNAGVPDSDEYPAGVRFELSQNGYLHIYDQTDKLIALYQGGVSRAYIGDDEA